MAEHTLRLVELDSLSILNIVDNELDPISSYGQCEAKGTHVSGGMIDVAKRHPLLGDEKQKRGGALAELDMEEICCGAHGLSLMIVSGFASPKESARQGLSL